MEQEQDDGMIWPVLYWSSKFRKYEQNYCILEKEALAVVSAITKLHKYLLGRKFYLMTDHRPLEGLLSQVTSKRTIARIERWKEKLACYNYEITYIKGDSNIMADYLSRSATETNHDEVPLQEESIINSLQKNNELSNIEYGEEMKELGRVILNDSWSEEEIKRFKAFYKVRDRITEKDGFLFLDQALYIPDRSQRKEIIAKAHEHHQGINRTTRRVTELYWWPGYTNDIRKAIQGCNRCEGSDRTKKTFTPPMHPTPLVEGPWQKVAVDLKGPLNIGPFKYYLVMVNYYSKWPEIIGLNSITTSNIIKYMKEIFARFGYPNNIVADNGRQLTAKEILAFYKENEIQPRFVSLYSPRQNGLVERFNKVIKEKLEEAVKYKWPVTETLKEMLHNYRSTPHSTTNISPFEAMFGRKMRTKLLMLRPEGEKPKGNIDPAKVEAAQHKQKLNFDKRHGVKSRKVVPGDQIRIKNQTGQYSQPKIVKETGQTSVTLDNNKKYPMSDVHIGIVSQNFKRGAVEVRSNYYRRRSYKNNKSYNNDLSKEIAHYWRLKVAVKTKPY